MNGFAPHHPIGRRRSTNHPFLRIQECDGDPITDIDHDKRTLTVTIAPRSYRPLGVYKALVKIALTLMDESDIKNVQEALRWLREPDLTTHRIDDGTNYRCIRSWTPGPLPIAHTSVVLLRRKPSSKTGPMYVMVLAFGNMTFQIVVPAPQKDQHLSGQKVRLLPVPVFALLDKDRVRRPTSFGVKSLASSAPEKSASSVVFQFHSVTEVTPPPVT